MVYDNITNVTFSRESGLTIDLNETSSSDLAQRGTDISSLFNFQSSSDVNELHIVPATDAPIIR